MKWELQWNWSYFFTSNYNFLNVEEYTNETWYVSGIGATTKKIFFYFVNDKTDNYFYPFAEVIWLCIRLNKASPIDLQTKIIFSDEAHFDLGEYVNKQNCCIEKPTHPKQVTVWCGFWSRFIIGPFFFQNEEVVAVTINSDRYRAALNKFLFTKIEKGDIAFWFQQNGYTCHTAEATLVWPTRSCDLTTLNYYLWGAVKDKCYPNKPGTIDALKDNISEAIDEIQLHTIDNELKHLTCRLLHDQLRQLFEWNYFPLLTLRIVLLNKKRNLRKYSIVF